MLLEDILVTHNYVLQNFAKTYISLLQLVMNTIYLMDIAPMEVITVVN